MQKINKPNTMMKRKRSDDASTNATDTTVYGSSTEKYTKLTAAKLIGNELATVSTVNSMSDNYLAEQSVAAIDHILELILSNLKINDLLRTRLLSRRFNYFSCKKIESMLTVYLEVLGCLSRPPTNNTSVAPDNCLYSVSRGTVEEFISTVRTANRFPCTSYSLNITNILEPRVQSFLTLQGCYIKTLMLSLQTLWQTRRLTTVPNQLVHLLTETLPNLQNLCLDEAVYYLPSNSEIIEVSPYKKFILPNLKSLVIRDSLNLILEMLMNAAINLQEYNNPNFYHLYYFTENPGSSRLHLLKHLQLVPSEQNLETLERIAELLATEVTFQVRFLLFESNHLVTGSDIWPRAILIINKILHKISCTVEEIIMEPMGFLPGIQFPVFSKVHKLTLDRCICHIPFPLGYIEDYFPVGFIDISRMFPILNFFVVCTSGFRPDGPFNRDINRTLWKPVVRGIENVNWVRFPRICPFRKVFERTSYN